MKDTELLKELGLSAVESRVYLALCEVGTASIRTVAAATGVNRGSVNDALVSLCGHGLVGFNQKGTRRRYVAEDPKRIYELLAERRRRLEEMSAAADRIVPGLLAVAQQHHGEPVVRFYEDDEGVAAVLRDVLSVAAATAEREYRVYSSRVLRQYIYRRFANFTPRRIEFGVSVRAIAVGEGGEPAEMAERRWLPGPTGPAGSADERLSSYVIIYGSKLALISVSADKTPYAVVVDEPGVAAMQRYLFDLLWAGLGTDMSLA